MEKNRGGRPRRAKDRSDHTFQVRLTEKEYITLQQIAKYQGGTAGQFLRNIINQAIDRGNNAAGAADIWGAHEKTN